MKALKFMALFCTFLLVLIFTSPAIATDEIRIGWQPCTSNWYPVFVGIDKGFYEKVDLTVKEQVFLSGTLAGGGAVLVSGLLLMGVLLSVGEGFLRLAQLVFVIHLPLVLVEGLTTGFIVRFLMTVNPEILAGDVDTPAANSQNQTCSNETNILRLRNLISRSFL